MSADAERSSTTDSSTRRPSPPSAEAAGSSEACAVRTAGLSKRFGDVHALDDLDLTVRRGEIVGYLGPNGAGKTTTLRLLLDVLRPSSGMCSMLGGSGGDPAIRARVGYLPGELHVDPAYTARDLLGYFGDLRGGVDPRWVGELLERFELDPSRPYRELSTGNRRKVGIVQAFMHRPELLLLDEPTSGLDPLLQIELTSLVREMQSEGASVLLSSHVVREVETLADRVAILRRGRLIATLDIADLRRQARQRIDLHLEGAADATVFAGIDNVVACDAVGDVLRLVVEGSVEPVIEVAVRLHVRRIDTHDTDLEEVFLAYYRDAS
jgi:ABC-2 type transport system ATP-binding protein